MKSFSCVPMRKRKSKTAVLKSADRNEEYSRKKNLWTKTGKPRTQRGQSFPQTKSVEERLAEAEAIKNSQMDVLERISEFTREQAKEYILQHLEDELVHEKAMKITQYEQQLKDDCEEKARNYISSPLQNVHPTRFRNRQFLLCRCQTMK